MIRLTALMLIMALLASCATAPRPQPTVVASTAPAAAPADERMPAWKAVGIILLLPVLLPIAAGGLVLSGMGQHGYRSYRGVHCKTYQYKDQWHSKCY